MILLHDDFTSPWADNWEVIAGHSSAITQTSGKLVIGTNSSSSDGVYLISKTLFNYNELSILTGIAAISNYPSYNFSVGYLVYASDGVTILDAIGGTNIYNFHRQILAFSYGQDTSGGYISSNESLSIVPTTQVTSTGISAGFGTDGDTFPGGEGGAVDSVFITGATYFRIAILANATDSIITTGNFSAGQCCITNLEVDNNPTVIGVPGSSTVYTFTSDETTYSAYISAITLTISATDFTDGLMFLTFTSSDTSVDSYFGTLVSGSDTFVTTGGNAVVILPFAYTGTSTLTVTFQLRLNSISGTIVATKTITVLPIAVYNISTALSSIIEGETGVITITQPYMETLYFTLTGAALADSEVSFRALELK